MLSPRRSVALATVCLCALSLAPFAGCRRNRAAAWLTTSADTGAVREVITATGSVSARVKVNVGSQTSGTLRRVCVDFGATVRRGELLAQIDPRTHTAQLARAEASVKVAEANLVKARVNNRDRTRALGRAEEMRGAHLVAQADLDAAEVARDHAVADIAGAEAALVQARADAALARANLAFTRIESPIDGIVLERRVDAGQTVAAQLQVATLFVIAADMRRVQLVVDVDEADVGKLRPPLPARFRVPAYPQRTFAGTVVALRPAPVGSDAATGNAAAPSTSGGVVTYGAVVEADNADGALRQGMTAELTVVVAETENAVRVPSAALRFAPKEKSDRSARRGLPAAPTPEPPTSASAADGAGENEEATLYVLEAGHPAARRVRLGLSDGQYVAILSGLSAGEAVVVGEGLGAGGGRGASN